jgi:hypothetical protein
MTALPLTCNIIHVVLVECEIIVIYRCRKDELWTLNVDVNAYSLCIVCAFGLCMRESRMQCILLGAYYV